jgi:HAD superfamily hydrolase (TIGR01509 family)
MSNEVKQGLIVFDLDGVLIDSKDIHYEALNQALSQVDRKFMISSHEHATTFDGLSTNKKLELLHSARGLPRNSFESIWKSKQEITLELLGEVRIDNQLVEFINHIKKTYFVAVASNSIRNTVDIVLNRLGISELLDLTLSNEDVNHPKPHPEIYWRCMMHFGILPNQTAIFEDSHIGRQSAINSGGHLVPIDRRSELT